MTRRRIAIVGLSWIGADPSAAASDPTLGTAVPNSHASAVAAIPELDLVAGCDIVAAARDAFLERWSSRWPNLAVYDDYARMLEAERPDIVAVATPDHLHRAVIEAAIANGARGIFCEKPIATNLEDADAIVAAIRAAGVSCNVNHTRRWVPEFVEARRLVRAGAIGRLSQVIVEMGGPRAMLFRNHTHAIDLVNFLVDAEPEWVWAELERGFEHYGTAYAGDGGNDPATEPGANYYIAYHGGARAYVAGTKDTAVSDVVVHVHGSDGQIVIDLQGMRLISVRNDDVRTKLGVTSIQPLTAQWTVAGMEAGILDLLRAMDGAREPSSPPEAARWAVAITQAILLSQARGNVVVRLDELPASSPLS